MSGLVDSRPRALWFGGVRRFGVCPNPPTKAALYNLRVCRNIKTLFNFAPPASDEEVRAASVQFVRKLSGFTKPSQANTPAFERAVDEIQEVATRLLAGLVTHAAPKDREVEAAKAKARSAKRFATL